MKIELRQRHYGVHELVKTTEINGCFNDYCTPINKYDFKIEEQKIIDLLPKDFLPVSPKNILVMVCNKNGCTGQRELEVFRNWAKYFDAYVLDIMMD